MGGISGNTKNYILYGTNAYVTVDGTDLGATLGDIEIKIGLEQYYPDFAQARGPVAGTGKVKSGTFSVSTTISEWSWATLSNVMGSIGADSSGASEKYGGAALDDIVEVENVVVKGVTRNDGKAMRVTIPKAYVEVEGFTLTENQETGIKVTFVGLYEDTSPTTLPGYIEIEK